MIGMHPLTLKPILKRKIRCDPQRIILYDRRVPLGIRRFLRIKQKKGFYTKYMINIELIEKLNIEKNLRRDEWRRLIATFTEDDREYAGKLASKITEETFGNRVFIRGIIEFSNICRNDCLYCGIRRSNRNAERYCLSDEDILLCCREGYSLGYRTFVLQSGESAYCEDLRFISLIREIKNKYPDCAVTLSVGECSRETYEAMYRAGADRYLLRHETADAKHYAMLHPPGMSFEHRLRCLRDLKEIGFQTGCGMMVGTPGQTPETLAKDMELLDELQPAMVGIGPFLPHRDTPFAQCAPGNQKLTLFFLSLTRIMLPDALIPATTALGTAEQSGRIQGILAGCNVVMPNLSPQNVRKKYMLYNNKPGTELSAGEGLDILKKELETIGRVVVVDRGDHRDFERKNGNEKNSDLW